MKKLLVLSSIFSLASLITAPVFSDGDPDFVKLPENYQDTFTHYATMNRDGKELVAKMYANDVAVASYRDDQQADSGSIVIMEVYKTKKDAGGKAVVGVDGIYEATDLAAIAVMERSDQWSSEFPADHRLEGWGFGFYGPDGAAKENDLPCVACHTPLKEQDYLFSFERLGQYVSQH